LDGLLDKVLTGSPWAIVVVLAIVIWKLYKASRKDTKERELLIQEHSEKEQALIVAYNQKLLDAQTLRFDDLAKNNENLRTATDQLSTIADVLARNGGNSAT